MCNSRTYTHEVYTRSGKQGLKTNGKLIFWDPISIPFKENPSCPRWKPVPWFVALGIDRWCGTYSCCYCMIDHIRHFNVLSLSPPHHPRLSHVKKIVPFQCIAFGKNYIFSSFALPIRRFSGHTCPFQRTYGKGSSLNKKGSRSEVILCGDIFSKAIS